MRILGLETSCDETAAAVVEVDGEASVVRSDVIHTQVATHALYGGVVPELASRDHLARVLPVVDDALGRAGLRVDEVDLFAVTSGPGLVGALLVGVQVAKALAWSLGKPLVGVNHLAGHAVAIRLGEGAAFPYVALIASGGHTALYDVTGPDRMEALGHTLDDAAGEAFDKVGKLLGLDYPAGAVIDRLAKDGDPRRHDFPRALKMRSNLSFSFSGLKTSVLTHVEKHGVPEGGDLADLCASFQEAVCDSLVTKTLRAAEARGRQTVVIGGGVAANSRLRGMLLERGRAAGLDVRLPAPRLCTDNGAMIALAGHHAYLSRGPSPLTLNADAAWRI
jgi:N6-L-threonylcarbamoyladenine synthase